MAGEGVYERYKDALKRGHVAAMRGRLDEAIDAYAEANRLPLRQAGLLTRDPRMKERKKYGLKRARKAPQYTKR